MIESGTDINVVDSKGRTAMHWGACFGRLAIVQMLERNGANVNARDEYGRTPLHVGIIFGKSSVVKVSPRTIISSSILILA